MFGREAVKNPLAAICNMWFFSRYPGTDPYDPGSSIGIISDLFKFVDSINSFIHHTLLYYGSTSLNSQVEANINFVTNMVRSTLSGNGMALL